MYQPSITNFMKNKCKYFLKYWSWLLLIIPIVVISTIACSSQEQKVTLITIKKPYILMTQEKTALLKIPVYLNDDYQMYVNEKNINGITIKDQLSLEEYTVGLKEVTKTATQLDYHDQELSQYMFMIEFPYLTAEVINMRQAYLKLSYLNGETHELAIGSIVGQQITSNDYLNIVSQKGIINEGPQGLTTYGILLRIANRQTTPYTITHFNLLNSIANPNYDEIIVKDHLDYDNKTEIAMILGHPYEMIGKSKKQNTNIVIEPGKELSVFIPLLYEEVGIVDQTGIIITYMQEDTIYQQTVNAFPLFKNNDNVEMVQVYEFFSS